MDQGRDPCPYRILDDMGGAFAMGAGGGTIWHTVRGWRNSPRGERLHGVVTSVKARAPVLGGNFAVWGLLFSSFDCTFSSLRRKEDPWNSIMAGAATGGLLVARGGRRAMARHALAGGILLALIEGLNIFISQQLSATQDKAMEAQLAAPPPVSKVLSGSNSIDGSSLAGAASSSFDTNNLSGNIYSDIFQTPKRNY